MTSRQPAARPHAEAKKRRLRSDARPKNSAFSITRTSDVPSRRVTPRLKTVVGCRLSVAGEDSTPVRRRSAEQHQGSPLEANRDDRSESVSRLSPREMRDE